MVLSDINLHLKLNIYIDAIHLKKLVPDNPETLIENDTASQTNDQTPQMVNSIVSDKGSSGSSQLLLSMLALSTSLLVL